MLCSTISFIERNLFQEMWPLLRKIEARWVEFANRLKIDGWKIDNIKANCFSGTNNRACCEELLTYWQRSTSKKIFIWSSVKKAAISLQHNDLVKSLEDAGFNGMTHIWCM